MMDCRSFGDGSLAGVSTRISSSLVVITWGGWVGGGECGDDGETERCCAVKWKTEKEQQNIPTTHFVHDRRGRDDQVDIVLALQPLLHDVHVQKAEEADAEAKAHGRVLLRLFF